MLTMLGDAVLTKTSRKMELLKTLIDHPRTGEGERDAARRMLARLEAKAAAEGPQRYEWKPRWAGAKYDRNEHLSTVQIAAMIRADIKMAAKVAKAAAEPGSLAVFDAFAAVPAGLRYGVRVPYYGSVKITVKNVPADWGYVKEDRYGHGEHDYPSEALRALGRELADIANAYNYDDSDVQTDYFNKNFYLTVTDEHGMSISR